MANESISRSLARSTLACGIVIVLGLGIPRLLTASIPGAWSGPALLPLAVAIWSAARLMFTGLRGGRRLTLMSFYVFTYVFFGIQPFLSVWYGEFPNEIYMPEALVISTGLLVLAGIVSFEAGYRLRHQLTQVVKRPRAAASHRLSANRLLYAIVVIVGVVLFVMATYGPRLFLTPRGLLYDSIESAQLSTSIYLVVMYCVRVPSAVLLLLAMHTWRARRDLELKRPALTLLKTALFVLCGLNLIVSNPISAPRLWAGSLWLATLFMLLPWKGRRSYVLWSTLSCLGLLLLFSGTDPRLVIARPINRGGQISTASIRETVAAQIASLPTDGNFDAYAMLASTVRYADATGYHWGSQLLLPALFWVPRAVWEDKPEGTQYLVARFLGLQNSNVGAPLWAEGYVNYGLVGVCLFLLIFGWLAAMADAVLVQSAYQMGSPGQTIVSMFFATNAYILLRGDLNAGTMYLQLMVAASFLLVKGLAVSKWRDGHILAFGRR